MDYAIGGTVQNLRGDQLVLRNNGGPALSVLRTPTGATPFQFPERLPAGSPWAITVERQPRGPSQLCQLTANGTGTVGAGDVNNIALDCAEVSFTVGGTAVGLGNGAVTLRLNGDDSLSVGQNGAFSFPRPLPSGADYVVSIQQQPADKVCSLQAGSGTVGDEPVTNIAVVCGPSSYTVSGSVSGLVGTGLLLRNNGSDDLAIASNGDFSFPTPVTGGLQYLVSVAVQPSNPWQTCVVANAAGQGTGNVSNVQVTCTTNSYTVGGILFNVRAAGLVLQLNGGTTLSPSPSSGTFVFPSPLLSNTPYNVTIVGEPAGFDCTLTNGSGTVTSQNIWDMEVSCIADGDTRANAFTLDLSSGNVLLFSGDTRTALNHASNSCGCTSGPDLFWRFTLATPSIVYADAFGTAYDVSLYLQDANGLSVPANLPGGDTCSDDACGTRQAQITARLPAGTHYLVTSGCGQGGVAQIRFHHEPAPSGVIRNVSTVGTSIFAGNLLGTSPVSTCYASAGAEDAFWWRTCPAADAGTVTASTCGPDTTFDTTLDYVSTTGVGACTYNGVGCSSQQLQLTAQTAGGAALHVLYVDSFSDPADAGYSLTVTRP